jgi:hypothetical protein
MPQSIDFRVSHRLNRQVRTRTYGGVGRVIREDGPYPIIRKNPGVSSSLGTR